MDPVEDRALLWIAQQGIDAELPSGWVQYTSKDGSAYFHNRETTETSWTHPADAHYWALYRTERKHQQNSTKNAALPSTARGGARGNAAKYAALTSTARGGARSNAAPCTARVAATSRLCPIARSPPSGLSDVTFEATRPHTTRGVAVRGNTTQRSKRSIRIEASARDTTAETLSSEADEVLAPVVGVSEW